MVVWAVPVERTLGSSVSAAAHWLPGLMLEALAFADTKTATTGRVLTVVGVYAVAFMALAFRDFARRDITA